MSTITSISNAAQNFNSKAEKLSEKSPEAKAAEGMINAGSAFVGQAVKFGKPIVEKGMELGADAFNKASAKFGDHKKAHGAAFQKYLQTTEGQEYIKSMTKLARTAGA